MKWKVRHSIVSRKAFTDYYHNQSYLPPTKVLCKRNRKQDHLVSSPVINVKIKIIIKPIPSYPNGHRSTLFAVDHNQASHSTSIVYLTSVRHFIHLIYEASTTTLFTKLSTRESNGKSICCWNHIIWPPKIKYPTALLSSLLLIHSLTINRQP